MMLRAGPERGPLVFCVLLPGQKDVKGHMFMSFLGGKRPKGTEMYSYFSPGRKSRQKAAAVFMSFSPGQKRTKRPRRPAEHKK